MEETNVVIIPRWFDRHLHIRDGEVMETVLPCTLAQRAKGAVIMPNLVDPITSIEKARAYRGRIMEFLILEGFDFVPCMTCYLTEDMDVSEMVLGFEERVWCAGKLYLTDKNGKGGTTGSTHGVSNLFRLYPVFEEMERYKIPLLGHFEAAENGVDEFDREYVSFMRDAIPILQNFPDLPVVFEHVTDGRIGDIIAQAIYPNLFGTVTAHHLMINRNDMYRGGMNPGFYCKPVPKREEDRLKIRKLVISGNPRFGAGTDSAPHNENAKSRCYGCAAGIFTAPAAVEMYATVFDQENALEHLGSFLSRNFLWLYGMEVSKETMTLVRRNRIVPQKVGGVQVFKGGMVLPWTLLDS